MDIYPRCNWTPDYENEVFAGRVGELIDVGTLIISESALLYHEVAIKCQDRWQKLWTSMLFATSLVTPMTREEGNEMSLDLLTSSPSQTPPEASTALTPSPDAPSVDNLAASSDAKRVLLLPPDAAAVVSDTSEEDVVGAIAVGALLAPAAVVATGAGSCTADVDWPQD